jgi:hypothetical protein
MVSRIASTVAAAWARDSAAKVSLGAAKSSSAIGSLRLSRPSFLRWVQAIRREIANSGATLELGEAAMDDDEHVLRGVFERGVGHAEGAEHAPHEREVRLVDLVERGQRQDVDIDHVGHRGHLRGWCRDAG